jgi:hypothetical protein
MSQKTDILTYLREGHSVTALLALAKFRCNRLAARIGELRVEGWGITTVMFTTPNTKKRVARYSLTDPAQKEPTGVPIPGRKAKPTKPIMLTATATKHFGLKSVHYPGGYISVQPGDQLTVGHEIYPVDSDWFPSGRVRVAVKSDGMDFVDISWVKVETPFSYR